ncbi:DUF3999 family protein [Flagellimonas sp. CMM7]|uniref:DUF3999 family protein n=1 Tax=Flagellimonas sp. CMM7 TaxID=2654676 RepID=UPI0013D6060F|nr:DUF3999 family protein [Flagellimonas sp. CMM7]UII79453.1 DUF3999 domain-containing protein [Flagellimonas sp. CMM7]
MKITVKSYTWLLLLLCSYAYGQMEQYDYKRELKEVSEQWHELVLPKDIFGKVSQNLSDIRIFGITNNDTIESPYLIRRNVEKISNKEVVFKMLNTATHNDKGYFFTFEIPTTEPINQIQLEFKQQNFDWQLKLEGSQDQQEWFTITDNYRMLSIKNEITDFQFTKLTFPSSKYRFFRLLIDSKEKPELSAASVSEYEITKGIYENHSIKKTETKQNKLLKQTEIDIELQLASAVSHIDIGIKDTFDYYRPVTIKYLTDSLKTEQGWKYNYSTLASGTLNSINENEIKCGSTTLKKLKILIHNQDSQALTLGTIKVKGYVHELVARFTEPVTYFLTYGNNKAVRPHYDIDRFTDKIPKELTAIEIGNELTIEKDGVPVTEPLFQNKNWLWGIMILMILLLGWFSLKMIKKK